MANNRKQGQRQRKSQSQKQRQSQRQRQSKSQRGGEERPEEKPQLGGDEKPQEQQPQRGGEGENANMKISDQTMNQAKQIAEGLLQNLANGQKGGNAGAQVAAAADSVGAESTGQNGGEFSAYETTKGLQGAPISGGSRSQRQRQRQRAGSKSLQNKSQKQRGGMMPGVMTAFETALVPLGLYLSQKALQSRSGRGKSSSDKSFSSRFSRRRGRK